MNEESLLKAQEIKKCPFCGKEPLVWRNPDFPDQEIVECGNNECLMYESGVYLLSAWNHRPEEDLNEN